MLKLLFCLTTAVVIAGSLFTFSLLTPNLRHSNLVYAQIQQDCETVAGDQGQTSDDPNQQLKNDLNNPSCLSDPTIAYGQLGTLISNLIGIALLAGAIVAFIYLILGAFQWGTAAAGEGRAKGRKTILYAIVGLIMLSLVYVFINILNVAL